MAIKWHIEARAETPLVEVVVPLWRWPEGLLEDGCETSGLVADLGDRAFAKLRNYS
jgi:hypothetical protein